MQLNFTGRVIANAKFIVLTCALALLAVQTICAEEIAVRYPEGTTHGFLLLRSANGKKIAAGDLVEVVENGNVKSDLKFHFDDGSLYDEMAVFSQQGHFQLLDYHLITKGPAFKQPMEVKMDPVHGEVTVHYSDSHGKPKTLSKKMQIPRDVANGLATLLVRNIPPDSGPVSVPYLATTPKPLLVRLVVTPQPGGKFMYDDAQRDTALYVIKIHIGGITGALAKVFGKKPPASSVWMVKSEVPTFLKAILPLGGSEPMRTIELAAPAAERGAAH